MLGLRTASWQEGAAWCRILQWSPSRPRRSGRFRWRMKMEQEQRSAVRTKEPVTNDVAALLGQSKLLQAGRADVARIRERTRQRRLLRLAIVLGIIRSEEHTSELQSRLH